MSLTHNAMWRMRAAMGCLRAGLDASVQRNAAACYGIFEGRRTMTTFREFEHAGWSDHSTAQAYHQHLGQVTRGCIPDLLEAAGVKRGAQVLDVACRAG